MKITADTATSLGNKLGGLELDEAEAALLHMMLDDDDEVTGFELDKSSTRIQSQARDTFRPLIPGPSRDQLELGSKPIRRLHEDRVLVPAAGSDGGGDLRVGAALDPGGLLSFLGDPASRELTRSRQR